MKKRIILMFILAMTIGNSVFAQDWLKDFSKAKELAKTENKSIVLVFQGSDWCAPCIKLDRSIWSSEEFKTYSKEHFLMVQADFPRKKQNALPKEQADANAKLAEAYNKNGVFPLVVVFDKNGKLLGETSYKKITPKEYISLLESFTL
ncbi:thioredoxin family protein [Maribacter sp. PR1]|uniref:Thioredoxin family protein n=1 Tax=Maribacter cobaltidurans TaxID=1178778 RepID=A0ABU7IS31_9FLAO|nr:MULTISPECIES: thioredoxin family protein [Maribacter]MDC6387972.1 thioredoxin family protein [Maribacter sp. PR1]MEE1975361.1 thioredoxin family protein [Maribacter cobaltidurans]